MIKPLIQPPKKGAATQSQLPLEGGITPQRSSFESSAQERLESEEEKEETGEGTSTEESTIETTTAETTETMYEETSEEEIIEATKIQQQIEFLNCGNDINCFISASETCSPAKVTYNTTIDLFGIEQKSKAYFEIRGKDNSNCLFYMKSINNTLKFSEETINTMLSSGASLESIKEQQISMNKEVAKFNGKEGLCKIELANLPILLKKWRDGNFSGEVKCVLAEDVQCTETECTGGGMQCEYAGDYKLMENCSGPYFDALKGTQ
ncbi:MAG: hypothetical protein N3D84_01310 [Candidatus Woesearchaeota archaeon]|nr:hypothetical protein [Candidatus Woesearchaeota archaeon]